MERETVKRWRHAAFLAPLGVAAMVRPAWAVQIHGGAEGLVAHQVGHVLFAGCTVYLLWLSRRNRWQGPGWGHFKGFLWLTILWNVLTFSGHWAHSSLPDSAFVVVGGREVGFHVDSLAGLIFYCASLDHLVLLPALICLAFALKQWAGAEGGC